MVLKWRWRIIVLIVVPGLSGGHATIRAGGLAIMAVGRQLLRHFCQIIEVVVAVGLCESLYDTRVGRLSYSTDV